MKKFLLTAVLILASVSVFAQEYNWAVGLRSGYDRGELTVKKYMGANAIDGAIHFGYHGGLGASALWEFNVPVITEGFTFYYGPGLTAGIFPTDDDTLGLYAGIEGVVGLEYALSVAPIAFSIDYRPAITVGTTGIGFGYYGVGLGIKFCF